MPFLTYSKFKMFLKCVNHMTHAIRNTSFRYWCKIVSRFTRATVRRNSELHLCFFLLLSFILFFVYDVSQYVCMRPIYETFANTNFSFVIRLTTDHRHFLPLLWRCAVWAIFCFFKIGCGTAFVSILVDVSVYWPAFQH